MKTAITVNSESDHTWVLSKDGWYMARWSWNETYAKDLEKKGYKVKRQTEKPEPGD